MIHPTKPLGSAKTEKPRLIPDWIRDAYVADLKQHCYSHQTITRYLLDAERFSRWLIAHDIEFNLSDESVQRFLNSVDTQSIKSLRASLRRLRVVVDSHRTLPIAAAAHQPQLCALDQAMEQFHCHLSNVHGLAPNTCKKRLYLVRCFLQELCPSGSDFSALLPSVLIGFFTRYGKEHSPGSTQCMATSIRSYLRFEQLQGKAVLQLIAAIPTVANWPQTTLPGTLTDDELARLFAVFDRSTQGGRRDYAMARCLVDLGLRASEVAELRLDDIHWREGRLNLLAPKNRRIDTLPLPVQTGMALAEYLENGRPATESRLVFLRQKAPHGVPTTAEVVRGAMRRAYARAGFPAEWTGTHRLRHTAATRMLRHGASIKAIADVLRHDSLDTTMNYARVDFSELRKVSMPWPGASS